jgi:hypothetical protein
MTPSTPIETVEQLREYLYIAMQLEHATIPPYLTAAYSADIAKNSAAVKTIIAVAREEMLHLTLAANLLNAIGGKPDLLRVGFVPPYPCHLPDGETDFQVSIASLSEGTIDTFLDIERPAPTGESHKASAVITKDGDVRSVEVSSAGLAVHKMGSLSSEDGKIKYIEKKDLRSDTRGLGRGLLPSVSVTGPTGVVLELHFWSIGEFYNAIRNGFVHLASKPEPLFTGDASRQVDHKYYFSAGGDLTEIDNLDAALGAIDLISAQGEGYTDEISDMGKELAHFYRFEQIKLGKYYQAGDHPHHPQGDSFPVDFEAVHQIKQDAKIADYAAVPVIEQKARLFNGLYRRFLQKLNKAFNGSPDLFKDSYKDMFRIKQEMEYLINNPLTGTSLNAAPTFEMTEFIDPPEES